jgi:tripeptide aminopeptidase
MLERFLRYARINTRSSETSETFPSTAGQWDLLRLLERELREMGLAEVTLDEHGYLFATLPSNLPPGEEAKPVGFLSHVDTYSGTNAENVQPQVIPSYDGGDITLQGDPRQVLRPSENPHLAKCVGHTIVTSDGTTLLGADDKAGIAEIMTVLAWYLSHPEARHGEVRAGFTPDEEIGIGTKHFDVARFGVFAAYTFDGSVLGEIEDETFCGDSATVTLTGIDVHPGIAKGRMVNALRAAAHFVEGLPKDHLPETTEKRESYLHPYVIQGEVGQVHLKFILRGFEVADLEERAAELRRVAKETEAAFPGVHVEVAVEESYRNMKVVLDQHPQVVGLAMEAVRRTGIEPFRSYIRGGTDGSALCFKGIPTPNIFAGGMNFHGFQEWVSLEWMTKAAETGINLVALWAQAGATSN